MRNYKSRKDERKVRKKRKDRKGRKERSCLEEVTIKLSELLDWRVSEKSEREE